MYDQMFNDNDEKNNIPLTEGTHVDVVATTLNAIVNHEYEALMKHNVTDGEMRQCVDDDASCEFHILLG